jgi:hypothetical protein
MLYTYTLQSVKYFATLEPLSRWWFSSVATQERKGYVPRPSSPLLRGWCTYQYLTGLKGQSMRHNVSRSVSQHRWSIHHSKFAQLDLLLGCLESRLHSHRSGMLRPCRQRESQLSILYFGSRNPPEHWLVQFKMMTNIRHTCLIWVKLTLIRQVTWELVPFQKNWKRCRIAQSARSMKNLFSRATKSCNISRTTSQVRIILSDLNSSTQNTSEIDPIYFFQILPPWSEAKFMRSAVTPKLLSGFVGGSSKLGGTLLDQFWFTVESCHPQLTA